MAQKTIKIKMDPKQMLRGTLFQEGTPKAANPAVLFVHGWKSDEKGYFKPAEAVERLGYTCLTINLRGHGTSDGDMEQLTLSDHLDDVTASYDFLADKTGVDANPIHVVGSSYGGYLAALLTSRRILASLVMRAPALYKDGDFDSTKGQREASHSPWAGPPASGPSPVREWRYNRALRPIADFPGKILLIESQNDRIIPHSVIELYIRAAGSSNRRDMLTYVVLEGAGHTLTEPRWDQRFIDLLVDWFAKQKSAPPPQ